jgi:hypothetical protein
MPLMWPSVPRMTGTSSSRMERPLAGAPSQDPAL